MGHNVQSDLRVLDAQCRREGLDLHLELGVSNALDTSNIAEQFSEYKANPSIGNRDNCIRVTLEQISHMGLVCIARLWIQNASNIMRVRRGATGLADVMNSGD